MISTASEAIDVQSDGVTVWVHRGGETIARFGKIGIDIHSTVEEQMNGSSVCLSCTHTQTTVEDWVQFVDQCSKFYGVAIDDDCMPIRFR